MKGGVHPMFKGGSPKEKNDKRGEARGRRGGEKGRIMGPGRLGNLK